VTARQRCQNLVRAATGEPVRYILDWFHLSMRMRPIEQVLARLSARQLQDAEPVQAAQASIERIRHLLWHGRPADADQKIVSLLGHGSKIAERNGCLSRNRRMTCSGFARS
jgi:hypothetical protein